MIAFLLFLVASFSGSLNPVFIKHATTEIGPITFTAVRFLLAAIVLLPFWFTIRQTVKKEEVYKLFPFVFNMGFYSVGIQYTSVIMSSILYAFVPLFTALLGYIFLREKLSQKHILGFVSALVGITLLIQGSIETSDVLSFGTPLGNILILIAVASWTFQPVTWRSLSRTYKTRTVLFFSFLLTAAMLLFITPFEWFIRPVVSSDISHVSMLSLLGTVFIGSILFYASYQWLIQKTSAFVGSLVLYGGIVSSVLYGMVFFGEHLTTKLVIGGLLVIFGAFFATTYTQLKKRA